MLKPHKCESCGTSVVQKRGWGDLIPQIPLGITIYMAIDSEAKPWSFVVTSLGMAFVAGVSLWAHVVRFKEAPKPEQFEPHSDKLKS